MLQVESKRKSRDISKHFFPRLVKLALEGIYGRDGYNRSGEPVPVFCDPYLISLGVSIPLPLLFEANMGYKFGESPEK